MGRRLHILVGIMLAAAVVVPLALAQQKDPLPGNDPEAVLGSDKPAELPLPDARGNQGSAPAKAAAKGRKKPGKPASALTPEKALQLDPTPGVPLERSEALPGPSEASAGSDKTESTTLPGQVKTLGATPNPSAAAAVTGEPPAGSAPKAKQDQSDEEVPALPPVEALDKPGAVPAIGEAPPAAAKPSRSERRERVSPEVTQPEPGTLPPAEERTVDPQVERSQAQAPIPPPAAAAGGAAEPGSSLPVARELPPATGGASAAVTSSAGLLPPNTLPQGKQAYGLTVEALSPQFANLNQDTTLKIVVRNSGQSDAQNVMVADAIPAESVQFVSSQPQAQVNNGVYVWIFDRLAAGSDQTITVRVRPIKTGAFDHAATVTLLAGSKSRTTVRQPKLKVEQVVRPQRVEKGQPVEFKIRVSNTGDGPARDVSVQATLSAGLRHEDSGNSSEPSLLEQRIARLNPGEAAELDPLVVDAVGGGDQSCVVIVKSKDVVTAPDDPDCKNTHVIAVTEPRLEIKLTGPSEQFSDTTAPYTLTVTNSGTAPTRKVTARAMLQVSGQLMKASEGFKYDRESRTVAWSVPQLAPGQTRSFVFEMRMSTMGLYRIDAAGVAAGGLHAEDSLRTTVKGMADITFDINETKRVVGVNDETTFQVKITNSGTKEATKIIITGQYSEHIQPIGIEKDPNDKDASEEVGVQKDQRLIKFSVIPSLGPGKSKTLSVRVKGVAPGFATFKFSLEHDDLLTEKVQLIEMATIRVTDTARK